MAKCPHCGEGHHFDIQIIVNSIGDKVGKALCCAVCSRIVHVYENDNGTLNATLQNLTNELMILNDKLSK